MLKNLGFILAMIIVSLSASFAYCLHLTTLPIIACIAMISVGAISGVSLINKNLARKYNV